MNNMISSSTSRSFYLPESMTSGVIKVLLIGLGGTGSAIVSDLFQLHGTLVAIGHDGLHVTAYDGDHVSQANIFRQQFWSHDINHNKAEVLINRLNQFGNTDWVAVPRYLEKEDLYNEKYDLVITAVDKASVRVLVGEALEYRKRMGLWLDLGNDNHQSNVLLGSQSSHGTGAAKRLPTPYELFGSQWREASINEVDVNSCSTLQAITKQTFGINSMTAKSAVSMILFPLLRNGELRHHGLFIDLHDADISKMPVDPLQWSLYGYNES